MSGQDDMHPIADRWGRVKNFDFCSEEEPSSTWPYMVWIQPSTATIRVRNKKDTGWHICNPVHTHDGTAAEGGDIYPRWISVAATAIPDQEGAIALGCVAATPSVIADAGLIYSKEISGLPELHYVDDTGNEVQITSGGGLPGVSDHGGLTGLADDDHPHYLLADGTRSLTGDLSVSDGVAIGIGPALERIEFDAAGYIRLMGCKVGIGITPDGTLHAHTATAGAVAAYVGADDIVAENSGEAGMSILVPDNQVGRFVWGYASDNLYHYIAGYGSTHPTLASRMMFFVADNIGLWIDGSGHVYPAGVKSQDLGTETYEWGTVHCSGTDITCGRLVRSTRICPVCSTEMVRGAGTLVVGGEESDFALAHCPNCGCAGMEEIKHLSPEKLQQKRPAPKVVLEDVCVEASGSHRKVFIHFRYGEDVLDQEGLVAEPAIRNATRLGEYEVDEFLAMNDADRLAFLLALGEREWYSREETRLIQEEAGFLKVMMDFKVSPWLGKDLLKESRVKDVR